MTDDANGRARGQGQMPNVRNNNRDAYLPLAAADSFLCCFLVDKSHTALL